MPTDPATTTPKPTADPDEGSDTGRRLPEAVSLGGGLWFFAVAVEVIHQLFSTGMRLINPGELSAIAAEAGASEALTGTTVVATIITAGTFSIAVMVFVAWAVHALMHHNHRSRQLRLLLTYFAAFFTIRIATLFTVGGQTIGDGPLWFGTIDGALQILTGAAAVTGVVLFFRGESSRFIAAAEAKKPEGKR